MLQLVLGNSGSGKTSLLYQNIKMRALRGEKSILIVPEQFTASTESRIYQELGDAYSGMVESFSFTSLAERILATCGGSAVKTLSDAGRAVLVRRAMKELQDHLVYYRKQRQNAAFCQMMAQTIDELKSAGVGAEQLSHLAEGCGGSRDKLADLALIYTAYQAGVSETELDPTDRTNLAAEQLSEACHDNRKPEFLQGRAVFIDEFDTFNAPKKRLLAVLFRAVDSICVALCGDSLSMPVVETPVEQDADLDSITDHKPTFLEDVSLFSGARRVAFDLRAIARKAGVRVVKPIVLRQDLRHAENPTLAAVNALLSGEVLDAEILQQAQVGVTSQDAPPPLALFAAESREAEARAMTAQMQSLARSGARYGSMAIVCRNPEVYRTVVRRECRLAGIPLFCDETTTPTFSAPVTAVRALLSILRGIDFTDQMVALAKTGLCATQGTDELGEEIMVAMPEYQILALENYIYTWSPTRKGWNEPFTRNPNGFGAGAQIEIAVNEAGEPLPEPPAETARKALLAPIERLCKAVGNKPLSATTLTKTLYQCLTELGAEEQQKTQVATMRKVRGIPESEAAAREWNVVMGLLDQMVQLLADESVTVHEYAELFLLLLNTSDLGHIPQNVDAVIFTAATKMRLHAPEYVFVLGLAEGEFPAPPTEVSLLSDADRDALMLQEVELPDCFENKMVREDMCFYKTLTAPAKQLWMSFPEGLALPLTSALSPIMAQLPPYAVPEEFWQSPTTPEVALDRLGALWGEDSITTASLYTALSEESQGDTAPWQGKLHQLQSLAQDLPKQLTKPEQVGDLYGKVMEISPSKVERYYTCQYAYFLQYVLRLRPREKAELTPNRSGSLMHWVLEKALTTQPTPYDAWKPKPFVELDAVQLKTLAEILVDAYQALYMPDETIRFGYLIVRLKKSMCALFSYLQMELRQSAFSPVACEATIGVDDFPAPEYPLTEGKRVKLVGVIDRIDTWKDDNGTVWMRVVDYKTGQKTFTLREVYDGLDCQMLLYLFAALRHWHLAERKDQTNKAAGVLYLLADPAPTEQERQSASTPLVPGIEGMLADDAELFKATDKEETGAYLPFTLTKGKPTAMTKKRKLADEAKMARIETHLDHLVTEMAEGLYRGQIAAQPLCTSSKNPCQYCPYQSICGHEEGKQERTLTAPDDPFGEEKESD